HRNLGEAAASQAAVRATRQHLAAVAAQQEGVMSALSAPAIAATEIYRVRRAMNAIAVAVRPEALARIAEIPGVRSIRPLVLEYPTTSTSMPFLGVPKVWENTLGLPFPATGDGISIGIIDTGVDYQHPAFGGTGNLTDYQNNDRTALETGEANVEFPTAKVVGGYDFAGDAYNGNTVPAPDPDPMDCFGHGSHVAGIAAAFGVVDATDTTFTGPWNTAVPFGTLSIGPGAAPEADIYALRVFGCGGATGLTVQAIEWAMDPNDDADLSDHLDVINMSLGSSNGSVNNATSEASENAALIGMIVVAAAGNSGDSYFIVGAPGVAGRAISVANIADSGIGGSVVHVSSPTVADYPALPANFVNNPPPPPPAPNGNAGNIVLVNDGVVGAGGGTLSDGCETPFANAAALAGNIALVDRGLCGFEQKVRNAQLNGAIAAIVANNVVDDPALTLMGCTTAGGCAPVITIPSVFVSQATGNAIKAMTPPVSGVLNGPNQGITAADVISNTSSRGPRRASSPIRLKPDVAAPGTQITSVQTGVTCTAAGQGCIVPNGTGFIAGGAPLTISGTSMATPHIAGIMALLRQLHPDWDVEELKALVMNNALHDVSLGPLGSGPHIGVARAGAGRTDAELTAPQKVTAFNDDEYGLVSASFAERDIVTSAIEVKTIRVVNHGTTSQTYDLAIELPQNADATPINDAPGVAFSIVGTPSITVPAGGTATLDVQMNATAAAMNHVREASVSPTQAAPAPFAANGNVPRSWLTEEGAHLTFRQSGNLKLRVPLYSAARPASRMTADDALVTGGSPTGSTSLTLDGTEVCTGSVDPGPTCNGTFPATVESLVTPFELQIVSPLDPVNAIPAADLQYGGVSFDNNNTVATADDLVLFGFSTWGSWSSLTDVTVTVCIDRDESGTWDRMMVNSNTATLASQFGGGAQNAQDTFVRGFLTLPGGTGGAAGGSINLIGPNVIDTRMLDNSVMFMAATPAQLTLAAGDTAFRWKVVTCPGFNPFCAFPNCTPAAGTFYDQAAGPYFYNYAARGLDYGPFAWLFEDLDGATIPVSWNTANLATNGSLGGLLLHHHNAEGERAEVFPVVATAGTGTADLRVANAVTGTQTVGSNVTFTVTVTNDGPETATGVVVADVLPSGLTWVSDDGAGAYNSASGLWTLPAPLASGGSAALQITATIDVIDEVCTLAQVTAGTPLDGDPSDNQAAVCVSAPRQADLAVEITTPVTDAVEVGDPVTFTIDLDNLVAGIPAAAQTAFGVSATVSFPGFPGLTMSGTPTAGTFDN
ncbi:MAG TPA: S8 family serine peptidase, partial [Micromonosporaceae bacterium]|nr:S8 family serine peptidase [Micromonosporaceae bacterium]